MTGGKAFNRERWEKILGRKSEKKEKREDLRGGKALGGKGGGKDLNREGGKGSWGGKGRRSRKALGGKGERGERISTGKGGGKDLREEREKIWGKNAFGGKGGKRSLGGKGKSFSGGKGPRGQLGERI